MESVVDENVTYIPHPVLYAPLPCIHHIQVGKSLTTGKRQAITDTVGKDMVKVAKQMKAALINKSLPVQRAAAVVHIFVIFVFFLS